MGSGTSSLDEPAYSDGRGDSLKSSKKVAPRYVYYRLYSKDEALASHHPIYTNDPFISRIVSRSVPPPRIAASLKSYLYRVEGFELPKHCDLYLSISDSEAPLDDSIQLPLRGENGPGSSEFEPMVLVVDSAALEKRSAGGNMESTQLFGEFDKERQYVHYRVYDNNGDATSKTSFDETDTALGRVDVLSIPPPYSVASLKRRLIKAEAIRDPNPQLFEDEDSMTAMNDGDAITLRAKSYPGITEDEPIAIVYNMVTGSPPTQCASFMKQLKAIGRSDWGGRYAVWHSYEIGDIFQTDGVLLTDDSVTPGQKCYSATNSSGKKACRCCSDFAFQIQGFLTILCFLSCP
ncbi:uncharacterized protein LACBIDRAFT_296556 [Laccaria bicolor S238N-H82]|uniref:Predicted protein n=1 Tax=Laccaria bicolor (strain S238N-H82 / ATCC MYA-4686) TaxID=486041 RepID=B0D936_LACBS|nr:uncharacterized protein LACBIDRAFT_296556 [Laccaria bicolor S238N-H82]EDR08941.1 predicted protein [Laccaria bicolor S238N-H82]|eukprot:XP_001880254.1 predicted protein [Laccaria bicolor S238N-H82]